jgi:hypothetical protein
MTHFLKRSPAEKNGEVNVDVNHCSTYIVFH